MVNDGSEKDNDDEGGVNTLGIDLIGLGLQQSSQPKNDGVNTLGIGVGRQPQR